VTDPAETPAQAIERLRREIRDLTRLRAQIPMLVLQPFVEDATAHIKEVAARLAVKGEVPAEVAAFVSRVEAAEASKPAPPPEAPPEIPLPGTRVMLLAEKEPRGVTVGGWWSTSSPKEYKVLVLMADGRLLTVKPSDLAPAPTEVEAAKEVAPGAVISSGSHVRDKTTGKTGFVSEIADDKAIVALDEGGFLTRPLSDLEPV